MKVLVVDDDPSIRRTLEKYLNVAGYEVVPAANGTQALRIVLADSPAIVITDWEMPEMDGLKLCRLIRSSEGVGIIYIIILTSHTSKDRVVEAFDSGADDYLSKPFHRGELLARVKAGSRIISLETDLARQNREIHKVNAELVILNSKLERMASTDELTGLANRRNALEQLESCWANAERYNQPFACLMLDLDHFKQFNDNYGHGVGDVVLLETARLFQKVVRAGETVCRLGGEEFLILCPNATAEMAAVGGERIRKAVEENPIKTNNLELKVTISVGVAERNHTTKMPDDLLKQADDALYAAKRAGRNTLCIAGVRSSRPKAENCAVASAHALA